MHVSLNALRLVSVHCRQRHSDRAEQHAAAEIARVGGHYAVEDHRFLYQSKARTVGLYDFLLVSARVVRPRYY